MKVLYVHEMYPPESVGGGETYSEMLVQQLKTHGIEVMVVAGTSGKTRTENRKGVKIYRVNTSPSRYMFNFKCSAISKIIKDFKPDIIHTNAYNAAIPSSIAGKKNKIPVYVVADSWKYSSDHIKIEQRASKEVWKNPPKNIKIKNPSFEKIDRKYIKAIVSELGVLSYGDFLRKVKV